MSWFSGPARYLHVSMETEVKMQPTKKWALGLIALGLAACQSDMTHQEGQGFGEMWRVK